MKVVVLGGNGFVGRHTCEMLRQAEHVAVAESRQSGVDMTELESLQSALQKHRPDVIVNCAANVGSLNYVTVHAASVIDANVRMILNLYRAVLEIVPQAPIINPVANCGYPGHLDFYQESEFWNGKVHHSVLAYGSSRRLLMSVSECYGNQHQVRSINLLVPNMYGPYDSTDPNKAHALNALASKFVKAKLVHLDSVPVWGTGVAIREWLYAGDFGRIVVQVLRRLDDPQIETPVNIAQNTGLSIRQIVNMLVQETKFGGKIAWDASRPEGASKKVMSNQLFNVIFPDFKFTSLADGLRTTVEYYQSICPY
jgi:GDP-L-fucose synthase